MLHFPVAATLASPYSSLSEPPGASAVAAAILWVEGTLLGSVATSVAVLAIFTVGLLMLNGRVDIRRGLAVVVGCFILFGASTIAAGIQSASRSPDQAATAYAADVPPPPPVIAPPPSHPADDPYAGASVPVQ